MSHPTQKEINGMSMRQYQMYTNHVRFLKNTNKIRGQKVPIAKVREKAYKEIMKWIH